jgi:oxygen-independent coproporphyrinogen-3 oxidase
MEYLNYLNKQVRKFLEDDLVFIENNILKPTAKGKFSMELQVICLLKLE